MTGPVVTTPGPRLRRTLGLLDATGVGVGAVIGAGIFVVTGIAAGVAGPALLVSLAIAGAAALCNALSSAQLAAAYPVSGGTYEYGYRVLGAWPGFVAGWMFLAGKVASAGTVAIGLGTYVAGLTPHLSARWIAVGAAAAFTALNWFGVRRTSRINVVIVGISVGALVALVAAGAGAVAPERFRPFAPAGWRGLLEAAALLFFAYTGYARIATLGEEVRDPARTIPRAIILTISLTLLLYGAVAAVAVGTIGADALAASPAPLAAVAHASGRPWAVPVIAVGGLTAMLGVLMAQILGLSRMVLAMSRRRDLPAPLAAINTHGVPGRAILVVGVVVTVVAATGALAGVAAVAAFTMLVYYALANLAALRMPSDLRRYPRAIPVVGLVACAGLAVALPAETILLGAGLLAVGAAGRWRFRERPGPRSER